jgi:hypothetical protein
MKTKIAAILLLAPTAAFAGQMIPVTTESQGHSQGHSQGDFNNALAGGWGLGVQAGIQGLGIHLRRDVSSQLYFKLEGNYLKYSRDLEIDDIDYDGEIDFSNIGLNVNYLPFPGKGFRITAGGSYGNKNSFKGSATGEGQIVEINDVEYPLGPDDFVKGSVSYDSFNPYLGVGWDWHFGQSDQFVLGLDLGVIYLGDPSVKLGVSPGLMGPGLVTQEDIRAEERALKSEIDKYKFIPLVKLSLTYRF